MGQRQGPETEVRGRVGDTVETEFCQGSQSNDAEVTKTELVPIVWMT